MKRLTDSTESLPARRTLLKGIAAGVGVAALPGLAACDGSGSGGGDATTVGLGSNYSEPVPKQALDEVTKAFTAKENLQVRINTKDHEAYQQQITNYLQGGPEDVWAWFAGYRLRFFAERGLVGDISELWRGLGDNFTQAQREASSGNDGKQYFVPFGSYPWAVFYRPSVWQRRGYTAPVTFDEYIALARRMKADGLAPIAAGQSNGWPQLGTFDQINFRTNGYEFHMALMAGKEDWAGPKVRATFDNWRRLLEFYQPNVLGRDWQGAAQSVLKGEAGMMVVGSSQIGEQAVASNQLDDLDFFPFPEIDPAHGRGTIEAPIDGFCLAPKPRNADGARKLLAWFAGPESQHTFLRTNPTSIAASSKADPAAYNKLQRKCVEFVNGAEHITQFLDRDTDPRFASDAAVNGVNDFLKNPNDVDGLVRRLADQAKTIFSG